MKWIELTEYTTDEKFIINLDRVDFITVVEEVTVLRVGKDEIAVNESPETILQRVERGTRRLCDD